MVHRRTVPALSREGDAVNVRRVARLTAPRKVRAYTDRAQATRRFEMRQLGSAGTMRLWQRLPAGVTSPASVEVGRPVRGGWIAEVEEPERPSRLDARRARRAGASLKAT